MECRPCATLNSNKPFRFPFNRHNARSGTGGDEDHARLAYSQLERAVGTPFPRGLRVSRK